ncbi:MAG: LamG-like jellyroll fold domain-containing protein [Nanoarchaeota archaeon]|nr:LamG-like jellyroll fold domain-containing protein [Nanoarchaeota archaeon]
MINLEKNIFLIIIIVLLVISLVYASTFVDNSSSNFNLGTYSWTFYNSSGFVQLNSSRLNGTFTSQIFNPGYSQWNNISWTQGGYYQQELPNNQAVETNLGWANMTGNVLLMHFNNDSSYGENSTRVYDFSGNGNNGTVNGSTWNSSGKLNGGYSFDGVNDYIDAGNGASLNITTAITLGAWVYPTANGSYLRIVAKYGDSPKFSYVLGRHETAVYFALFIQGGAQTYFGTAGNVPLNVWSHVIATWDGATMRAFVNGVDTGVTRSFTGPIATNDVSVKMGAAPPAEYPFNGIIDEVAIWNRSLSASEILSIYKRGALRLNLSVQSCNDSACSGESFTNLGANLTSPQNLSVANNTYFQYKFDFATDSVSYTPELYNVSINYDLLDNTAPSITLNSPANNTNTSLTNINFNFTAIDETSTTLNCSLYIDNVYKNNNGSTLNNTATILNASGLIEGSHNWTINCSDASKNYNVSTRIFLVDTTLPSGNLTSPSNGTYANSSSQNFTANISDNLGIVNTTLNIYNSTNDLVNQTTISLGGRVVNTVVGTVVSLVDGIYKWFYGIIDSAGNVFNVANNTVIIDTTKPLIDYGTGTAVAGANLSQSFVYVNVTVTETNDANITFALYNTTALVNSSLFTNGQRITNWTGLIDGNYSYNVSVIDLAGNRNMTSTRGIILDTTPPAISNIIFSPNGSDDVDPYKNITFNVSVVESVFGVGSVILQYYNGSAWNNQSMSLLTGSVYTGNITLVRSERNYTYNVLANDSLGNSNNSVNQTFNSTWDCTWSVNPASTLGQTAGFNENKRVGELNISNTGDAQYSNNNCTLGMRLTYDLAEGRIYFDNSYLKPSDTYTISAKANSSVKINGTFLTEIKEDGAIITINDIYSRSNIASNNVSATLVSTTGGPYLFEVIESATSSAQLTKGNLSLVGYMRNLVGDGSAGTTAYNVSFNWTLPSGFSVGEGNASITYGNISDSNRNYNNINITLNLNNLPNLSPGTFSFVLYAWGYNSSGTIITHATNRTILSSTVNITLSCYNVSDGVYVTACGSLDGDYVAPSTPSSDSASGSGGGGGGGGSNVESVRSTVDYSLVRGKENEINLTIKNKYTNNTIKDISFTLTGKIAKYITVIPSNLPLLNPGESRIVSLSVTSPTFLQLGKEEITLHIRGTLDDGRDYTEDKKIVVQITEVGDAKAISLVKDMGDLIAKAKAEGIDMTELEKLLNQSRGALSTFSYEQITKNYELVKQGVEDAIESKQTMSELQKLVEQAAEKGISTSGTERILKLAQLSFNRQEYSQAKLRAKEAKVTYALEVKGEIGKLSYYLKNNPKEISLGVLFLALLTFTSYKIGRLELLKKRIKKLQQEEKILMELMKVVQEDTFQKKKMSMEEYQESMAQYEKKLSLVVEELIDLETQRLYVLKFTSESKRLKLERQRVTELIRELQRDYLQRGKLETKSYQLKLESYTRRLSEIDQRLATLEAKAALKGLK